MVKYQMACENVQLHLKQTSVDVMGPFLFTHVKILIPMRKMSCMNVYNSHVKIYISHVEIFIFVWKIPATSIMLSSHVT